MCSVVFLVHPCKTYLRLCSADRQAGLKDHMSASVSLEFTLELLGQSPVSLECSTFALLIELGVPTVELAQTVAEAQTLLHGKVSDIGLASALSVTSLVGGLHERVVLLHVRVEVVLFLES